MKASDKLKITLKENSRTLEDVVVVGYGVQKKRVVTASIAKVSADDLDDKAAVRVDNALKGLASGVTVTSSSGQPGAASQVRIRGIGTIDNSNPLYIVDRMPIEGGIDYLNPSDIESIEVLKDAAIGRERKGDCQRRRRDQHSNLPHGGRRHLPHVVHSC